MAIPIARPVGRWNGRSFLSPSPGCCNRCGHWQRALGHSLPCIWQKGLVRWAVAPLRCRLSVVACAARRSGAAPTTVDLAQSSQCSALRVVAAVWHRRYE